jgi:hypothetical protein
MPTLQQNAPIDLQLHTTYSDGAWLPEQLLDYLLQAGFGAAAITDHDRLDHIAALQAMAKDKNFLLLPAIEMSTHWRHENDAVDMLCFGFDLHSHLMQDLINDLVRRQQENIWQTVTRLAHRGYRLPDAAVQAIVAEPSIRQPHSLVKLVKEYAFDTGTQSTGQWLADAGLKMITHKISAVVTVVQQSGGVCFIAHPGRGNDCVKFDEPLLDQLRREVAIDGLEAYYPEHTTEQVAMFKAYADKHGLLTSAGSDSHTPENPPIQYPAHFCRRLLERLGIQLQ